ETPYNGTAFAIPGTIPASEFDNGGEGLAYHDTDTTNSGGQFRTTGVDTEGCSEGGFNVGWTAAGERPNDMVNVSSAGSYDITDGQRRVQQHDAGSECEHCLWRLRRQSNSDRHARGRAAGQCNNNAQCVRRNGNGQQLVCAHRFCASGDALQCNCVRHSRHD